MAQNFAQDLKEWLEQYQGDTPREGAAADLRTQADLIERSENWPPLMRQVEAERAAGRAPLRQPTEGEMKHALAAKQAAELAERKEVPPDYAPTEDILAHPERNPSHPDPSAEPTEAEQQQQREQQTQDKRTENERAQREQAEQREKREREAEQQKRQQQQRDAKKR